MSQVIENPMVGKTYRHDDEFGVYEYGTYESGVLEGQEKRTLLDKFGTLEEAKAAYPHATVAGGSRYRDIIPPKEPPPWFDPDAIGERWEDD